MAYVVQIVSGQDVHEVDFMLKPNYADVDSAIRSFSGAQAKYTDEEGDLCTLSDAAFEDFLATATQKDGITLLTVQLMPSDRPTSLSGDDWDVMTGSHVSESFSDDWEQITELDFKPDSEEEEEGRMDDKCQQTEISPMATAETVLFVVQGQTAILEEPRNKSALAPKEAARPAASAASDKEEVPVSKRTSAKIISSPVPLLLRLDTATEVAGQARENPEEAKLPQVLKLGKTGCDPEVKAKAVDTKVVPQSMEALAEPDVPNSIEQALHEEAQPCRNPTRPAPSMGAFSMPEPSAPESQGQVSCKVCCQPVRLYLPAPFKRWACDVCKRTDFTDSDPMWACPTARACNWGMCMDCHEFQKNSAQSFGRCNSQRNSIPSSDISTASNRSSTGWGMGRAFGLLMCMPFLPMYLAARSCHRHNRRRHGYGPAFPRRHHGNCRRF
mmetsp:Transcript_85474/g.151181  ORF Transcript_85474/g.151181 Transcript_85474/m.151181 type:complete len:442 (+) Transcript_85474:105-1430(+)